MKKVELLAPAGSYEGFLGAIHAGADAVYIGGKKYGARAYAANFTEEEVCLAIRYAHLFGRKLYLTVNTLVRESEIGDLPGYIRPFYEAGLDGAIVQDMGVFSLLRETFPSLPLHGSTQMTITGARGAGFLTEQGASRVVPARELSLEEIRKIKETGIEVEAFIHGAMCYCYSGQCLFSSMLGGRSGNRGRCAQPCRLPYALVRPEGARKSAGYYLSLKDMCTLPFLPQLIEAGIDSFKIEGRMKKPEYTAGVTAVYRKYIDRYYAAPDEKFAVAQEDMEKLRTLYIRSEIQEGYYHKHNGRDMITPDQPGYAGTDETYLQEIRRKYLEHRPQIPVCGEITLKKEKPALLVLRSGNGCRVCQEGQTVQAAQRQPLTKDAVEKQLRRTGNTVFVLEGLTVRMETDVFLPVKALNDLRRAALSELESVMAEKAMAKTDGKNQSKRIDHDGADGRTTAETDRSCEDMAADADFAGRVSSPYFAVQIQHRDQLAAVAGQPQIDRIYMDGDLITEEEDGLLSDLALWKEGRRGRSLIFVMPYIIRLRDEAYLERIRGGLLCDGSLWDGVLVRNLESLCWLRGEGYAGAVIGDANLYVWNRRARDFYEKAGISVCAPLECSKEELGRIGISGMEVIVYGRALLMVTANCVRKTALHCPGDKKKGEDPYGGRVDGSDKADSYLMLRDRYGTDFPVRTVCAHCYNEIYNSVPLSLHEYGRSVMEGQPSGVRLVFTTEKADEIRQVLLCYREFVTDPHRRGKADFSYTKGHYKRGAE